MRKRSANVMKTAGFTMDTTNKSFCRGATLAIVCILIFVPLIFNGCMMRQVGPTLSGEFRPLDRVDKIYGGPFFGIDQWDLLVVGDLGGLAVSTGIHKGGTGFTTRRLALYSFNGKSFTLRWQGPFVMLDRSDPTIPISRTVFCTGNFAGHGKCQLVTMNVDYIDLTTFQTGRNPERKMVKAPKVWIDEAIACDINGDGIDEVVTLEYPDRTDSCCVYHVGIYTLRNDSLVQIWRGLDNIGQNHGMVPAPTFISKCRINGCRGEVPVMVHSQSDVRPSTYSIICESADGQFSEAYPFPHYAPETEKGAPCLGMIFSEGSGILTYGQFLEPNRSYDQSQFQFAKLEEGSWRPLYKRDSTACGNMCQFSVKKGQKGWLFLNKGRYYYYDKLPLSGLNRNLR